MVWQGRGGGPSIVAGRAMGWQVQQAMVGCVPSMLIWMPPLRPSAAQSVAQLIDADSSVCHGTEGPALPGFSARGIFYTIW
jgi:hypothetical protein